MDEVRVNEGMVLEEANHLSISRTEYAPGLYAIVPKAFLVPGPLPAWEKTKCYFLASSSMGAGFSQCKLKVFKGGGTKDEQISPFESFFFIRSGKAAAKIQGKTYFLQTEDFAYLPPECPFEIRSEEEETIILWIRKRYVKTKYYPTPEVLVSSVSNVPVRLTTAEKCQMLLPEEELRYDMGCNIMAFDPGVTFPCTEMHVFEHGEYVLNGRASIFLNGTHHEMMPDDFIFIHPYCPHYVTTYGPGEMRYLLFKDLSRDYEPE